MYLKGVLESTSTTLPAETIPALGSVVAPDADGVVLPAVANTTHNATSHNEPSAPNVVVVTYDDLKATLDVFIQGEKL